MRFPIFPCLLLTSLALAGESKPGVMVVADGKPTAVYFSGERWKTADGTLAASGVNNYVFAAVAPGRGDFTIKARLRMLQQRKSAAGFQIGEGFFGFEGAKAEELFVNGKLFGGYRSLGPSGKVFKRGAWIDFEAVRKNDRLEFRIDGKPVHTVKFTSQQPLRIGFTPHRSTMQISHWLVVGETSKLPRPLPRGYSIPLIDLAGEKHRQTIIDREPGQYLGHPTTVLLEDGRTLICVYPKGHGRGPIVMKRSSDAGKTWSDRLKAPQNWATSKETPTIHRVVDPKTARKRLILFSGLYPIRMAVSEDDGKSWTPLKPIGEFGGIVAMSSVLRLANGDYVAIFHDDGRFIGRKHAAERTKAGEPVRKFFVYQTVSRDGGLTWSSPVSIATHASAHLCEPGAIRSPDGKQIAVLLRENSRRHNSFVIFSNDEAKTWSKPRELPASLTGDRHVGRYSPDGRLVISFRDTTHVSATKGDWVAWVGKYSDIAAGKEGQYRVRLMDNHKGGDCAYPGVELLPDGTFVCTTYGHWTKGESPYIVSVRFRLKELDAKAAAR